ncbi:MAG: outer membrane protein assembly factor [Opitutales bacterium]
MALLTLCGGLAMPEGRGSVVSEWFGDERIVVDGAGFLTDLRLERSLILLAPSDMPADDDSDADGEDENGEVEDESAEEQPEDEAEAEGEDDEEDGEETAEAEGKAEEGPDFELNRVFIEDSMWLLAGEMRSKGYLYPTIVAHITWEDGDTLTTSWNDEDGFSEQLPEGGVAQHVRFEIQKGKLFYFAKDGLTPDIADGFELSRKLQSYFYAADATFTSEEDRYYTQGRLNSGMGQIASEFKDEGYQDVRVTAKEQSIDRETGAVTATIVVRPGKQHFVREAEITFDEPDTSDTMAQTFEEQVYTQSWLNGYIYDFRTEYYERGYPDAEVFYEVQPVDETADKVFLKVDARVESGPQVTVGDIRFVGDGKTEDERLREVLPLESGGLLNPNLTNQGRGQLRALNIFDEVEVRYEPVEGRENVRDVIYETKLRENFAVALIFGVGTFDIVRGGFELVQNNLWHLAHQQRLRLIQSLKTSKADYEYTIPKFLGRDLTLFGNGDFLRREQINFIRQEFGAGVGLQRFWGEIGVNASIEQRVELVTAEDLETTTAFGDTNALITSILARASQSAINNPVYPSDGYRVNVRLEVAYPSFTNIEYEDLEISGAFHQELLPGTILHIGASQGLLFNITGAENIPVTQRFLLGGENTVRGYSRDEASPRNDQGEIIGAESFSLAQVQLEQRITSLISLNVFVDSVLVSADLFDPLGGDLLMSVGPGISFRTPIGPLRFEYGYNLMPRDEDPTGTFHFSLGFPF